jgi:hypothetical protein
MSEWFYETPIPNFQVQQQVSSRPQGDEAEFDITVCLPCDYCGGLMEPGEEATELFYGVIGKGPKSGQPMVVESALVDHPVVSLHLWCIKPFVKECLYIEDDEEETARYCSGCEAKLSGR